MSRVDPSRLRRALALDVHRHAPGTWRVEGGARPHVVTDGACDCYDWMSRRPQACKHLLAVELSTRLTSEMLAALRSLMHRELAL